MLNLVNDPFAVRLLRYQYRVWSLTKKKKQDQPLTIVTFSGNVVTGKYGSSRDRIRHQIENSVDTL